MIEVNDRGQRRGIRRKTIFAGELPGSCDVSISAHYQQFCVGVAKRVLECGYDFRETIAINIANHHSAISGARPKRACYQRPGIGSQSSVAVIPMTSRLV